MIENPTFLSLLIDAAIRQLVFKGLSTTNAIQIELQNFQQLCFDQYSNTGHLFLNNLNPNKNAESFYTLQEKALSDFFGEKKGIDFSEMFNESTPSYSPLFSDFFLWHFNESSKEEKTTSILEILDINAYCKSHDKEQEEKKKLKKELYKFKRQLITWFYLSPKEYETHPLKDYLILDKISDKEGTILEIMQSNLGKTEFKDVNFEKFERIKIQSSNLTEITQYGYFFPHKTQKLKDGGSEGLSNIYRDLAYAIGKQGDTDRKLNYQATQQWHLLSRKNPASAFVVIFNKISNNFGRNWLLALLTYPVLAYLLFALTYLSTEKGDFGNLFSIENLKRFSKFMDPTRRIFSSEPLFENLFYKNSSNWWTYILQMLSYSILIAWLYQLIQAFRKYRK